MGKFSPGSNRRHAVINGSLLRPPPPGYLIASPPCTQGKHQGEIPRGNAMSLDRILIARVLCTLMSARYAFLTVDADFNKTHATNPEWTPHARFHVVWQISSYIGFGLLALALIWWSGPLAVERLYLVALMGAIVYAAFFAALIALPIYGGAAYDRNGYQPFQGATADFCQKVGREYHRFLDSARHPGRRTIGSHWCIRRLTEEPPGPFSASFDEHFFAPFADHRKGRHYEQASRDRNQRC